MTLTEFEHIYKTLYRPLYLYAGDFIADADACRDILSDVFVNLWNNRESIVLSNIEAYLRVAVRNACVSHIRRYEAHEKYAKFAMLTQDEAETLDTIDERYPLLEAAIKTLPEKTRFVLEQCSLYGLTYKQTAALMGITPDGVKKHIVKAYAILREYFKKLGGKNQEN